MPSHKTSFCAGVSGLGRDISDCIRVVIEVKLIIRRNFTFVSSIRAGLCGKG